MNWYFSKKLGNARLNFSKSGIGYSIGVKGARLTKRANAKSNTSAPSKLEDSDGSLSKGFTISLCVVMIIFVILLTIGVETFDIGLLLFMIFVYPIIGAIIIVIIVIIEATIESKNKEKEEDEGEDKNE